MNIFVTGIGTGVGKTIASAIITEALKADYWKPIQTGIAEDSDRLTVSQLVTNSTTKYHPERYGLKAPLSPHQAAKMEGIHIDLNEFKLPNTTNHLVIEGAGGVMVPINNKQLLLDLIFHLQAKPVIISRHYLGSINHTLLTYQALKLKGINPLGIIFNGNELPGTEEAILDYTNLKVIGRIAEESRWTKELVSQYANTFAIELLSL